MTYEMLCERLAFLHEFDSSFSKIWLGLDVLAISFSRYYDECRSGEIRDVRYIHDFPSMAEIFGFDTSLLEQAEQEFKNLYQNLQYLGHLRIKDLIQYISPMEKFSTILVKIASIRPELLMPVMGWANTDSSNHMLFEIGGIGDAETRHRYIVLWTFVDLYVPPNPLELNEDSINELRASALSEFHSKIHLIRSSVSGIIKTIKEYRKKELDLSQKIDSKYAGITNALNRMLEHISFYNDSHYNWALKRDYITLLNFLGNLLGRSYDESSLLRTRAVTWENEVSGMHPWINDLLRVQFGDDFTYNSAVGGGICDLFVFQIPIECKLLKTNQSYSGKHNQNDETISKLWEDYQSQILRYAGRIGLGILCVVDVRPQIVSSNVKPFPLPRCVDIKEVNGTYLALFLYQCFTGRPSDR